MCVFRMSRTCRCALVSWDRIEQESSLLGVRIDRVCGSGALYISECRRKFGVSHVG
jgi:hypothetical protein